MWSDGAGRSAPWTRADCAHFRCCSALEWRGYKVTHVPNITDVEDKIIAKARAEGLTEPEIAKRYERIHREQLDRLGALPPHHVPHATEYIDQMLDLIGDLIEMGHACEITGSGVYFEVPSYAEYRGAFGPHS